jgi:hypothetical protein
MDSFLNCSQEEEVVVGREMIKILLQSREGYQCPVPLRICEPKDEIEPRHEEVAIDNAEYAFVLFTFVKDLKKGVGIIQVAHWFVCPLGW